MIDVKEGEKIPLRLQVWDGRTDLKVTATLINQYGDTVAKENLRSAGLGLYQNDDFPMGTVNLTAVYLTSAPDDYPVVSDSFRSIPKPQPEEKILVGEVVDVVQLDDEILVGEVE